MGVDRFTTACLIGGLLAWAQVGSAQSGNETIDYATARLDRPLVATRATSAITLDGSLEEQAWRDAPMANHFIQNDPKEGLPATFDTDVRAVYDDQALYFGVFARDDQPASLIVSDLKKDFNINTSDVFCRKGEGHGCRVR